jgi:putative SOS response-associated peptidase YedK
MCGRFAVNLSARQLEEHFQGEFEDGETRDQFQAHHNIRPSNSVPVITTAASRQITLTHWGFAGRIFNKQTGQTNEKLFINARGETLDQKKSFKAPFLNGQRCLFLMSHFYEWMGTSKGKIPFAIGTKTGEPFAVAGLFQYQEVKGQQQMTTTLITTAGNRLMELVHNQGTNAGRMPVILTPEERQTWLDEDLPAEEAKGFIKSYPDDDLQTYPVQRDLTAPADVDFKEKRALEFYAERYGFALAG